MVLFYYFILLLAKQRVWLKILKIVLGIEAVSFPLCVKTAIRQRLGEFHKGLALEALERNLIYEIGTWHTVIRVTD